MSSRESVYVSLKVPFESPPSPNSTVDHITMEIRMFYPPNATPGDLIGPILEAIHQFTEKLTDQIYAPMQPGKVWLAPPTEDR